MELAVRLDREADELQKRFEEAFWVEDQRYYAMGLDAEKQADAIGSNAGQCLWTGIVSPARARDVADRLLGARRCTPAGGSGRTPPTSRASTRSATTPGPSGRTTPP